MPHLSALFFASLFPCCVFCSWRFRKCAALQAVELVPLPEGVPEVLRVTCNGRSGQLLVRTQRVLQGETEMSASKFEQVCGKGDAKKWKCSIWTEGADGQQVMVNAFAHFVFLSLLLCMSEHKCVGCLL